MKKFRKIMAILVAAIMIVAMAVPAWADGRMGDDDTNGEITIAVKSEVNSDDISTLKFDSYRMFDLASFSDATPTTNNHSTDAYAYVVKADSPWIDFINAQSTYFETITKNAVAPATDTPTVSIGGTNYYIVKPKAAFQNARVDGDDATGILDEDENFEWTSVSTVQAVAQAAIAFAKNYVKTAVDAAEEANKETAKTTAQTALNYKQLNPGKNTGLKLGYYVIDSETGTLCALDTTNKSVTMYEKNGIPVVNKEVKEDSESVGAGKAADDLVSGYQDKNDANIGQTVYYRSLVTVRKGAQNYVLHDQMDPGLTYNKGSVKVFLLKPAAVVGTKNDGWIPLETKSIKLDGSTDQTKKTYPLGTEEGATVLQTVFFTEENADTNSPEAFESGDDFAVIINPEFLTFLSDQMNDTTKTASTDDSTKYRLMVTYNATLNQEAEKDSTTDNKNVITLNYGDGKSATAEPTYTATWTAKFRKYNYNDDVLGGAQFKIKDADDRTLRFKEGADGVYVFDEDYMDDNLNQNSHEGYADNYKYALVGGTTRVTDTLVTPSNGANKGIITVQGLDSDTYTLEEVLAPAGYYPLESAIKFHIIGIQDAKLEGDNQYFYVNTSYDSTDPDSQQYLATTTVGNVVYDLENSTLYTDNNHYDAIGTDTRLNRVEVKNNTTTELPSTGGMGTTVLYIVGGMLVILAGAYLFFSRKRTA